MEVSRHACICANAQEMAADGIAPDDATLALLVESTNQIAAFHGCVCATVGGARGAVPN